jgi:purine-binding chemotaxis protein CheW
MKSAATPTRAPIDWARVRARLGSAERAMEEALHLPAEAARVLLEERARQLARVPPAGTDPADKLQVAVFSLARERYAIEVRHVRAIVRMTNLTPLPGAVERFAGVTNLRGEIVAVIDLRKLFGLSAVGLTDLARVIVLGDDQPEVGILADQVHELRTLSVGGGLAPWALAPEKHTCIRGVTRDAIVVLDGTALLADPRLYIDDGART